MRAQREVQRAGRAGLFAHSAGGPGGILILSRLPILYHDSYVYKNRGVRLRARRAALREHLAHLMSARCHA